MDDLLRTSWIKTIVAEIAGRPHDGIQRDDQFIGRVVKLTGPGLAMYFEE